MSTTTLINPEQFVWHEETDPTKLGAITRLDGSGHQFAPVHVTVDDDRYLIIDGAHRSRAALLNRRGTIPAVVHRVFDSTVVPGWSHAIPSAVANDLFRHFAIQGAAPGVAFMRLRGLTVRLGTATCGDSLDAMVAARHAVAAAAYSGGTRPLHLDAAAPGGPHSGAIFTWAPLTFGSIRDVAHTVGVLPATTTRFEPILRHWNHLTHASGSRHVECQTGVVMSATTAAQANSVD